MRKLYTSMWLLFCALTLYAQKSNAQDKQAIPPRQVNQTIKIENSFETETKDSYFNYTTVNKIIHPSYARTGKASLLLHSKNSYSIIHSKLIPLRKNSEVSLKVQALYPHKGNFITKALAVAGASASVFQANKYLNPIVQSENDKAINKKLYPTFGFGLALAPELLKERTKEVPKAYLRCLVYDKDTNLIDSQIKLLDRTAKNNWQEIALNTKTPEDGYLQVTFVNESKKDVLVDDLSIIITKDTKEEKEEEFIAAVQSFEAARLFSGSIANTMNVQSNGECSPPPYDGGDLDTVQVRPCTQEEKCDPSDERCYDPQACYDGGGSDYDGGEEPDNNPNSCDNNPFQCECSVFWCDNSGGDDGGSGDPGDPNDLDPINPLPPGGGTGQPPAPPINPVPVPQLPPININIQRVQQHGQYDCVFAVMEMIARYYGCPNGINQNYYSARYEAEFPNNIDGVRGPDVDDFLNTHFGDIAGIGAGDLGTLLQGVVPALNAGDPVVLIQDIPNYGAHAVLITGYEADGTLLIRNPSQSSPALERWSPTYYRNQAHAIVGISVHNTNCL